MGSKCPPDKILNPATNRCVNRTGKIGIKLLADTPTSDTPTSDTPNQEKTKKCDKDKILNPATNRCVKRTSKIGKSLEKKNTVKNKNVKDVLELTSGSRKYEYYALKYLNGKYKECFIQPLTIIGPGKGDNSDYELVWEDKPPKEVVVETSNMPNFKLYGNSYAHYVDKKHRPGYKHPDGLLYVNEKVTQKIMSCMKNKARFIIISLNMRTLLKIDGVLKGNQHANVLFYDKKKSTLERYDPHGPTPEYLQRKRSKIMDVDLVEYFTDIGLIKSRADYYAPIDFCPRWTTWQKGLEGHQFLQNLQSNDFSGSCSTWCMWYIDERLGNPNKDRDTVIQDSIAEMKKSSRGFTKFIKNYYQIIMNYYIENKNRK